MSLVQRLHCANGASLAYTQVAGRSPGVVFFTGFKSDMQGAKALALEAHLKRRGNAYLRFDYRGHGQSSGSFEEESIGSWAEDARTVLEQLTSGPQVLVGSSMGGWIMLLTALRCPERIAGLLGVAAAPDFTEDLLRRRLAPEQQAQLATHGKLVLPSCYDEEPYVITQTLIEEARQHLLLNQPIAIDHPIRLIHGMQDEDVPWQTSCRISELVTSQDVELHVVKSGDHRLSSRRDLERLCLVLDQLLDQLEAEQK